ncbi:MAG: metallophosphoesterase [Desulfosarcinaceae bacterium]
MRQENQFRVKVHGSLLWGLLAAFFGSLLALLVAYSAGTDWELQAGLAGAGWTGVVFVLLSLFLLSVSGIFTADFLFLLRKLKSFTQSDTSGADPDRRQFLNQAVQGGLILLSAGLARGASLHAAELPVARVIPVPVKGLPGDLDGFRIVHLTDIHADPFTSRDWVEAIVRIANSLAPHLIAITGDLADGSVEQMAGIVRPLADLSAPFGRYFVTGNHEYHVSAHGVESWISHLEHLGFQVLLNSHRLLTQGTGTVLLGGVTDYFEGNYFPGHASSPAAAIRDAAPADVRILMAHQPKSV